MEISLKAARINSNLTQEDAAKALNISPQTIGKYERDSSKISMELLEKMSKLYKTPMDYIFLGSNTNKIVKVGD